MKQIAAAPLSWYCDEEGMLINTRPVIYSMVPWEIAVGDNIPCAYNAL